MPIEGVVVSAPDSGWRNIQPKRDIPYSWLGSALEDIVSSVMVATQWRDGDTVGVRLIGRTFWLGRPGGHQQEALS